MRFQDFRLGGSKRVGWVDLSIEITLNYCLSESELRALSDAQNRI